MTPASLFPVATSMAGDPGAVDGCKPIFCGQAASRDERLISGAAPGPWRPAGGAQSLQKMRIPLGHLFSQVFFVGSLSTGLHSSKPYNGSKSINQSKEREQSNFAGKPILGQIS